MNKLDVVQDAVTETIHQKEFLFWGFNESNAVRPTGWQANQRLSVPRLATVAVPVETANRPEHPPRIESTDGGGLRYESTVTLARPDGTPRWWLNRFIARPGKKHRLAREPENEITNRDSADATPEPTWAVEKRQDQAGRDLIYLQAGDDALAMTASVSIQSNGTIVNGAIESVECCSSGPVTLLFRAPVRFVHQSDPADPKQKWRIDEHLRGNIEIRAIPELGLWDFKFSLTHHGNATHPNGTWNLGDWTSVLLENVRFEIRRSEAAGTPQERQPAEGTTLSFVEPDQLVSCADPKGFAITQGASGGKNWASSNHQLPEGRAGAAEFGCRVERLSAGSSPEDFPSGRPHPFLTMISGDQRWSLAMERFWQNFPCRMATDGTRFTLELLCGEAFGDVEFQAGEQKTWRFAMECSRADHVQAITEWLCPTIDVLAPEAYSERTEGGYFIGHAGRNGCVKFEDLISQAIDGTDTFWNKSERIDEFGWRNFGDIYGDHEAVYQQDPPLISHYNNQYDCTLGLITHFFRRGDRRWFDWASWSADHAWDIDTYHASDDKLLYNGGLFWHTYHYADAGLATHRSYPAGISAHEVFSSGKQLNDLGTTGQQLQQNYAVGGGPAASHNYPTGWMWLHMLTGDQRYRDAAVNAADYVLRIEDGKQTPFRWFSSGDTGYSTCSSEGYHGPGRAAANSLRALLTGHELTGDCKYLERAALLMRRTVHPKQDLEGLDLLNAELRWFYTMYLQALGRYVDYKLKLGERDADFRYGVATLRHYARWMARHEQPTLSQPDKLQYPTETWAAQDMRKWHVLEHAARYESDDDERQRMWGKADFFFNYSVDYLTDSPTKSLCRPVVLMLNFGWQRAWLLEHRDEPAFTEEIGDDFGQPATFVPQREIAIRRFKRLVVAGGVASVVLVVALLAWLLS